MTKHTLARRDILKTISGGMLLAGISTQPVAASGETIYSENFEEYSPNSVPSDIVLAGNSNQEVVDSTAADGSQSYKQRGDYGGCWRALGRIPLELKDEMTLRGQYKLEGGNEGCHTGSGRVRLRTSASSLWSAGSAIELLRFNPDGTVTSNGDVVGEFERQEWVKFEVEYDRNKNSGTVTHRCKINDGEITTTTRDEASYEGSLSALELASDDFTVFWDEINLTSGLAGSKPPADPEPETKITGVVSDSSTDPLEDIKIRVENRETNDQITATTDNDGAYNISVEADTEYRVFVFDQYGLEYIEFEEFVQVEQEESLEVNITLLSKFEIFEDQKLGSDRIAGLAPRIDDLTTPLITEKETVATEINDIKAGVDTGDIDQELADEAIERMVFGEAIVNRSLEALTDATPINLAGYDWSGGPLIFEDEMPNFELLYQTAKAIVIGLVEASYSLKKIAKDALAEFKGQIIDRILNAIERFLRDVLSDFQGVLETADTAWSIGEMLSEIKAAADEAKARLYEGATRDNVRDVILEIAEPLAEQVATSLLAGAELLSIQGQLNDLNTTLGADSLANGPEFANDINTIADDTRTKLGNIDTQVQQAEDAMEPESDALGELIELVQELQDAGLFDLREILVSIWNIARDLVSVISSGFNIGFGIVRARDIYTGSATVVDDITETM